MPQLPHLHGRWHLPVLMAAFLLTILVYWPGLAGAWLLDDYPNIVDNTAIHITDMRPSSLLDAALSSTASNFKRPLASLSFAINYRLGGLDPFWMKFTNLAIHLLNGLLVFLLAKALLTSGESPSAAKLSRSSITAAIVAAAWMLLPINLSGVLYVVQRMDSLANLFVLLGLLGYVNARRQMLAPTAIAGANTKQVRRHGLAMCAISIVLPTACGFLAKETAVMLPLYALLVEWALFHSRRVTTRESFQLDSGIVALFTAVLVLPLLAGLVLIEPIVFNPAAWNTRNFTLETRLLSEPRVIFDYIRWTLLPTTHALSFYHDSFEVSTNLFKPWTTLISLLGLAGIVTLIIWLRHRLPLVALGLALFLAGHLLTGTILPLELVYEHRNYFASFGLLLALMPLLTSPEPLHRHVLPSNTIALSPPSERASPITTRDAATLPYARLRHLLLAALLLSWTMQTALYSYAWGDPLRLAQTLVARDPHSPRAVYDLGRTYTIYSRYNPASPFVPLAYSTLEHAAKVPGASILPEQALIFFNARMGIPAKASWWASMLDKLHKHQPTVQDIAALRALSTCAISHQCSLPPERMAEAFRTALAHPHPNAQLLARFGEYAWNVLGDRTLGERVLASAIQADPSNTDYYIAWIHMLLAQGHITNARHTLKKLEAMNSTGSLDTQLAELHKLADME